MGLRLHELAIHCQGVIIPRDTSIFFEYIEVVKIYEHLSVCVRTL